ncbi:hypothetical protein ACNQFZ_11055 [Schinkia sp. CFF1]
MWVVTLYLHDNVKMYEFETEEEAKEKFDKLQGCKILSEVIYYTDFAEADVMQERDLAFARELALV